MFPYVLPKKIGRLISTSALWVILGTSAYGAAFEYTCNCGEDYKDWNVVYNNSRKCRNASDTACIASETTNSFVYRSSYEHDETGCTVCGCNESYYPFNALEWESAPNRTGVVRKPHYDFIGGYLEKSCTVIHYSYDFACARGFYMTYYDFDSSGGTSIGCARCPSIMDEYGSEAIGTSTEGNLDPITSCYLTPASLGTFYDIDGTYVLTGNCYYKE